MILIGIAFSLVLLGIAIGMLVGGSVSTLG